MIAFSLELTDDCDRDDDFVLVEAEESGGICKQDAGIEDISLASFGAAAGQVTPSYSVFLGPTNAENYA